MSIFAYEINENTYLALSEYEKQRNQAKMDAAASRTFKAYQWEVPEERIYDSETNKVEQAEAHALIPFVQLNDASNPEKEFVAYLEQNGNYIDWWYKNGDKGKQHYAIEYRDANGGKSLFYVDFIVRMKNGHIYLFETKTKGSDMDAPAKHNALLEYVKANSTEEAPLHGGVIIKDGSNWLYSKLPIENTTDTLNWDSFYPQNA